MYAMSESDCSLVHAIVLIDQYFAAAVKVFRTVLALRQILNFMLPILRDVELVWSSLSHGSLLPYIENVHALPHWPVLTRICCRSV